MVVDFVGRNTIHNTTSWKAYAAWTWEVLRRLPDYITYYESLVLRGFQPELFGENSIIITQSTRFEGLEKFGLLYPANPALSAEKSHVFWHPIALDSVMRFHIIDEADIDPNDPPILISNYPANRTHYRDENGTHHIRFLGENFWFQIRSDDLILDTENVYIGIDFNRVSGVNKRVDSTKEFCGIYDGSISINELIHVPKRHELFQQSLLAYDVKIAGGTWNDVAVALHGEEILKLNPDEFQRYWQSGRNAFNRAESYIYGDFLKILHLN